MQNRNLVSLFFALASTIIASIILFILPLFIEIHSASGQTAPVRIPINLKANVVCAGTPSIHLSWTNPNEAKDFTIFRNPTPQGTLAWAHLDTSSPTTYIDTKVKAGSTYRYQIRSVSPAGSVRHSDIVIVSNIACGNTSTSTPAPTTPKPYITFNPKLSISCVHSLPQVSLSWQNPNDAKNFTIFRNPNSLGAAAWSAVGAPTTTSFVDTNLKVDETYKYQIQAIAPDNSLRYSDILSAAILSCEAQSTTTPPVITSPATTTPSVGTTTPTTKELKWGAYSGWQTADMDQFEKIVGGNPDHIAAFTHWGNNNAFPTYMTPYAKDKGRTLIIFWEASNTSGHVTDQPAYSYDAIIRGDWDAYIKSFAAAAKAYGGPVILIPFSEMNGNWSPWSGVKNGNTPAEAVLGYRHVRNVFGNVPNVKFGWAPNSNSVPDTPENAIEKYYPGDAYVDYVGVDGFNFNDPWMTFDQIFKKPLTTLSTYNKPIYIFSFASADGAQKAAWIKDAIAVQIPKYPLIEGWNWFNQNKERNWLVWSNTASLEAFKALID